MREKPLPFQPPDRKAAKIQVPERPAWLQGEAAAEWDRLAATLAHNQWLDDATATGFAEICVLGAEVRRLERLVDELGLEKAIESKVFDALLSAERLMLDYWTAFFMTPLSRAQHSVTFKPLPERHS